jgi:hypothetical protein
MRIPLCPAVHGHIADSVRDHERGRVVRRRRIAVAEEAEEGVYRTVGFVVLAAVMGMGPLDLTVIPGRGVAGDRWAEAASRPGDPISASSCGGRLSRASGAYYPHGE